MTWKKVVLLMVAAMVAAYFGARMAAPENRGVALAGGASVTSTESGMVAVTTGADGANENRLVMVDTVKKRLLVYGLYSNYMRLIVARPYKFDMKLHTTDTMRPPGDGLTFEKVKAEVMRSDLKKEEKESLPRGREMVLTTDASGNEGNRIILINTTEKRICVYRLNRNFMGLISARHYDFDNYKDFMIKGYAPRDGYDYKTVRSMVEAELKKMNK
jgi:hypothetical protein